MSTLTMTAPRPVTLSIGAAQALRHALALAGRSIAKIRKNPETLLDVTLQPILFLLAYPFDAISFAECCSAHSGWLPQCTC